MLEHRTSQSQIPTPLLLVGDNSVHDIISRLRLTISYLKRVPGYEKMTDCQRPERLLARVYLRLVCLVRVITQVGNKHKRITAMLTLTSVSRLGYVEASGYRTNLWKS